MDLDKFIEFMMVTDQLDENFGLKEQKEEQEDEEISIYTSFQNNNEKPKTKKLKK